MSPRSTLRLLVLSGALVAVLLPAFSQASPAASSAKASQGMIAFSAPVHGISQVFTIRPEGTGLRQVTHEPFNTGQYGLTWSPDGNSLLYTVNGTGTSRPDEIVKSAANGSGATVTSPPCSGTCLGDDFPDYSPDGKKIAFERAFGPIVNNNATGGVFIFTMNLDGRGLRKLTQGGSEAHQAQWSPNGKEIAFQRWNITAKPRNESAIEVMNADGSNVRRLTPWRMRATDPRWSPNGKRILFNTNGEPVQFKSANLFTIRPDGTGLVQLTHYKGGPLQAWADGWSPDGTQILFERLNTIGPEVGGYYVLNLHTRHIRRLTAVRIHDNDPRAAWGK